jgi:ABC-type multidrug transport system fused ATPase/permease subunit
LTVLQVIASLANNQFFYRGMIVGGQTRAALISIIFDKAMTISGRAKAGGKSVEKLSVDARPTSDEEKKHFGAQLETGPNKERKEKKKKKKDKEREEEDESGWGNGRIVNLMSVDTYRIDQACGWVHMVWSAPLTLTVTIVLLVINLTYSALVGILLFLLSLPVVTFGIIVMFKRRKIINKITDERVTIIQEALSAIRFIKYYAWENDFLARLARVRRREIGGIRWLLGTRNVVNTIGNTIPIFASMLSFITFSATNHVLDPAPVFSSLALFNQLRAPLILIPMILGMVTDALQSVSRIEEFLLAEDSPREDPIVDEGSSTASTDIAVDLKTAAFTWEQSTPPDPNERLRTTDITAEEMREAKGDAKTREKEAKERAKRAAKERKKALKAGLPPPKPETEEKKAPAPETPPFKIEDINLRIGKHELVGVVGVVGCGKSSLLSAISGQMRQTDGSRVINGRIAYCSQVPWIQNATVRDNITFGQAFDQEKYDRVIEACSLAQDLRILPHGSSTEIGERGINLSGGQKHRVSLARAIYFDADIFLLDDPLAAVDAHVGAHLMDKAICGLLENKCRILATHQLHVLARCNRIVLMDKGRIAACDTFQNLMTNNETFKRMLATVDTSERAEKETEAAAEGPVPPKALELSQDVLMQEEDRQVNSISWEVWLDYWRSTGSLFFPVLILATLVLAQGCNIMTNLWLAWWSGDRFGFVTGKYVSLCYLSEPSYYSALSSLLLDRNIRCPRRVQRHIPVRLDSGVLSVRNRIEQTDATPRHSPFTPCAHILFRHYPFGPHHQPLLQGHRRYGQQSLRVYANGEHNNHHGLVHRRPDHIVLLLFRHCLNSGLGHLSLRLGILSRICTPDEAPRSSSSKLRFCTLQRGNHGHADSEIVWRHRRVLPPD